MTYPALQLTPEEERWIGKYADPKTGKRGVLRKLYRGFLNLNDNVRLPVFPFQIARRCRVFAMTFTGDIVHFQIEIIDVTGEKHTAVPVFPMHLTAGSTQTPYGLAPAQPKTGFAIMPYIIEPNIVLLPNQTLTVRGYEALPQTQGTSYRMDFGIHVWEFPGMEGSPQ